MARALRRGLARDLRAVGDEEDAPELGAVAVEGAQPILAEAGGEDDEAGVLPSARVCAWATAARGMPWGGEHEASLWDPSGGHRSARGHGYGIELPFLDLTQVHENGIVLVSFDAEPD